MEQEGWDLFASAGLQPDQEAEQARAADGDPARYRGGPLATPAPRPRSPSPSTACRSTFSPSGSAPRAARSTRRCTTPAASCARSSRPTDLPRLDTGGIAMTQPGLAPARCERCSARPQPRSAATRASTSSTATSTSSCRATTPMRAVPGMRAHLDGCPACREEHESLRASSARPGASRRSRRASRALPRRRGTTARACAGCWRRAGAPCAR